jgi:hypothetical protein
MASMPIIRINPVCMVMAVLFPSCNALLLPIGVHRGIIDAGLSGEPASLIGTNRFERSIYAYDDYAHFSNCVFRRCG